MQEKNIINVLQDEFIGYASEILVNNLPSIDGLLPVNRKVIWGLYKEGIVHNKPFIKMLRASSFAMIFYIFGDLPLTSAMKNMGNNSVNYFYLDPKGSFGDKQRKEGVGASPRYIECRLSEYSESMLQGVNKNNVTMRRNFDNTEDEPIILPSIIPNLLTNTSQSISIGEASKIPSHNMDEVCDSFISYINDGDIDKAINLLKGADFSIGGQILYEKDVFENIYKTGRGSFTLTGKYVFDEKENKVSIIEVPYETYIEDIETKLRACYDKGIFKEIVDIHDGTDKDGIRLDIYLKKNTDVNQFIAKLRKNTTYECKFPCNFTVLDLDGKTPVLMSLEDIINKWTLHRKNCIRKEIQFDIDKNIVDLNKLYGLKIINSDLDKAIQLIRSSKTEKIAAEKLINHFNLNSAQAEYIATIRLLNINEEWIDNKIDNIVKLEKENIKLTKYINCEKAIKQTIVSQLEEVKKKYGKPRRTEIIYPEDDVKIIVEDIPNYNVTYFITKENYFKKIPLTSLRSAGDHKLKDGDIITEELNGTNLSNIIFFSNKGNIYNLTGNSVQDTKTSLIGDYLPNLLNLDKDETIIKVVVTNDFVGNILFAYENGKIAKVPLESYRTNRSKLMNGYNTDSKLINIFNIKEDIDLLCKSSINKIAIANTILLNPKASRTTQGQQILKSKNNSAMVYCVPVSELDGIEDIEYYRINSAGIGSYLKKTDSIE